MFRARFYSVRASQQYHRRYARNNEAALMQMREINSILEQKWNQPYSWDQIRHTKPSDQVCKIIRILQLGTSGIKVSTTNSPELRLKHTITHSSQGLPQLMRPEIAFIGRSNVGKSYLINALTSPNTTKQSSRDFRATASISSTPGHTQSLNYYACDDICWMVDMPGYGFADVAPEVQDEWKRLLHMYLANRASLRQLFILIDARYGIMAADREFLRLLYEKNIPFDVIFTKCDAVKPDELARRYTFTLDQLKSHTLFQGHSYMVSSKTNAGIERLRRACCRLVDRAELIPQLSLRSERYENAIVNPPTPAAIQPKFRVKDYQNSQERGPGSLTRLKRLQKRRAMDFKR